jgi:hypothetical protein
MAEVNAPDKALEGLLGDDTYEQQAGGKNGHEQA